MLISLSKKFIFLSNPKCGTSSIRALLAQYTDINNISIIHHAEEESKEYLNKNRINLLHITAHELKQNFKNCSAEHIWDGFYKFSTIRNPFRRAVSWYFFLKPDKNFKSILTEKLNEYDKDSMYHHHFNDWLDHTVNAESNSHGFPNYDLFCTDWDTEEDLFDDVFKLEEIDDFFPQKLEEKTGIKLESPIPNYMPDFKDSSESGHMKFKGNPYDLYNDSSIKLIEEHYAKDLEKFNYKFGD